MVGSQSPRSVRCFAVVAAICLTAAACSSSADDQAGPKSADVAVEGDPADDTAADDARSPDGESDDNSQPGGIEDSADAGVGEPESVPGEPAGPGSSQGGGSTSSAAPGKTATPRPVPGGKGVTADKILVGFAWLDGDQAGTAINAAFGTQIADSSGYDPRGWVNALAKHVNQNGGIAGRKLEPVFFQYPTEALFAAEARRRTEQQMCAHFTEDNKVAVMMPLYSTEGVIAECAKSSDTPMIAVNTPEEGVDQKRQAEIGRWWYRPNYPSAERREQAMVARLVSQGFFGRNAKVGIMVQDRPAFRRGVERALKPELAKAGVEVVSTIAYPELIESPWDSYVLQFRSAGVTHIVWAHSVGSGAPPGFFMRAAENQRWRARHALGSEFQLNALPEPGLAPLAQLEGARGIGWFPNDDRGPRQVTDGPINASDQRCRKIIESAGFDPRTSYDSSIYCEVIFFLKASLDRAPSLDSAGLAAATESMGAAYEAVTTYATAFGVGRHDGAAAVRDLAYDPRCKCFAYTSGPIPVG